MSFNRPPEFMFTTRRSSYPKRHKSIAVMALLFFSVVGGGYIFLRSTTFFASPDLVVDSPEHGALIAGGDVKISGATSPKTLVTINGYESFSDENGVFEEDLPFQSGFHVLDIRVRNRVGKETRVVRHIVVE